MRTFTLEKAPKRITSLLLYAFTDTGQRNAFQARYEALKDRFGSEIPDLEFVPMKDGEVKAVFDLSRSVSDDIEYHHAICSAVARDEDFVVDLLSSNERATFYLSALIEVNADIVVFELKSPRFSARVASLSNFEFDYWVWHTPNTDETVVGDAPDAP